MICVCHYEVDEEMMRHDINPNCGVHGNNIGDDSKAKEEYSCTNADCPGRGNRVV